MTKPTGGPRGRPRRHLDDADRAAAYRERKAQDADLGAIARAVLLKPTARLIEVLVARMLKSSNAKGTTLGEIRAAVDRGIAAGYRGGATPTPARQGDIEAYLAALAPGESPDR